MEYGSCVDWDRFGTREAGSRRTLIVGVALFSVISVAVFWQLFRDGGLTQPGQSLEGAHILAGCAAVSVLLAALLDWKVLLRTAIALPVVLLVGLAILSLLSGSWSITSELEADRYGFLIGSYAALCASAAVLASRFGPVPLLVLISALAIVSGAMGLWAFAELRLPMASRAEEFEIFPAGPFLYKNALSLTAAAALLPLLKRSVFDRREWPEVTVTVLSGLGLGIVTLVLALGGSDFSVVLSALLIACALIWPERIVGLSRQQVIGVAGTMVFIGVIGFLLFREVLTDQSGSGETRLSLIVLLVLATPAVAWLFGLGAPRIRDRVAALSLIGVLVASVAFTGVVLTSGQYGGGGDLTQTRRTYYDITIETAKLKPVKGTGAGSFQQASGATQVQRLSVQTRFAHTIPGEMWVELGLAGLVLSLLLYFAAFRASWRAFRISGAPLLIPLAVGFLLNGLIDWNWHFPAITALWAMALGGLTGLRLTADRPRDPEARSAQEVSEPSV